jgi:hypothetical protein
MESGQSKRIWVWGGILIVVLIVGLTLYYYRPFFQPSPSLQPEISAPSTSPSEKILPKERETGEAPFPPLVALKDSDSFIEKFAKDLSTHPRWAEWLKIKDLIRKITAATDNIAQGKSPRAHLTFLDPKKPFLVKKADGKHSIHPQGYLRYNMVAEIIHSLDIGTTIKFYQHLRPLFQEAYRDLGYPNKDFHNTLIRAIVELLDVPIVEGEIDLEEGIGIYTFVDEELEEFSDAQKHLLRMGPENMRKIQRKLLEFASGLGIAKSQLPQTKVIRAIKK